MEKEYNVQEKDPILFDKFCSKVMNWGILIQKL